ncbi:MAG: PA14 domain-containing protein [candidate division FCPU426 bacterium]
MAVRRRSPRRSAPAWREKIAGFYHLTQPGWLGLAVVLAWMGQDAFAGRHLAVGLVWWLAAMVLAGSAYWRQPDRIDSEKNLTPRLEGWILAAVVAVAAVVRWWHLADIPHGYHFDEAMNALIGLQMLQDPAYVPIFGPPDAPLPTLYHYYNLIALKLGGISAYATKWVPAMAGTATVAVFYFLARRVVSRPVALAAALLLALMRWHINFSRINYVGILTPLFAASAGYFLLRGLETKNRWHMAWSGLSVSLGLYTYYASNLVPFVLGPYLALQLVWDRDFLRRQWQGLLFFLGVSLAVFAPLGIFALTEPQRFFVRNQQVLIFNHVPPEQAVSAFWNNVKTTLLMFNYFGDCNGRHNLPETPMLDPVTGVLFGLGLAWSLAHLHRPHAFLAVWWFLVALVPGFLTIEAPQGYRCIGAIVPVALLAAIGLERLWQAAKDLVTGTRVSRWLWLALPLLLAWIGVHNVGIYFGRQANHTACWSEFNAAEAGMGWHLAKLGPRTHAYISAGSYNYPTIRFLAQAALDSEPFQLIHSLPSNDPGDKDLSYLLLPIHDGALELLRFYYPGGKETAHRSPFDFTLFTSYEVSRQEVLANRGLAGIYLGAEGKRKEVRTVFPFRPASLEMSGPVTAKWEGSLRFPNSGRYLLRLEGAATARIYLDGRLLGSEGVAAAEGWHRLSVSATLSGERAVALYWRRDSAAAPWNLVPDWSLSPKTEVHGLTGAYFRTTDWSGDPLFRRVDPLLSLLGHDFSLSAPFSVRWEGTINAPRDGHYLFEVLSNEAAWLYIDGKLAVANEEADRTSQSTIRLAAGPHAIRIDYQKKAGAYPRLVLSWQAPGQAKTKLPFTVLSP